MSFALIISMAQKTEIKKIEEELKEIRNDLKFIKEHMEYRDVVLTKEEEAILEQSLKEYREGKTTRLEDLKKELGR